MLKKKLSKKYSNIILLDGDVLRNKFKIQKKKFFSYKNRKIIGLKYVLYCRNLVNKNKFVIIAAMALIKEVQKSYKKIPNTKDIFLDVPLRELIKRDPKKLYKKFFQKKINNMAGLDLQYDKQKKPSLVVNWNKNMNKKYILKKILKLINE